MRSMARLPSCSTPSAKDGKPPARSLRQRSRGAAFGRGRSGNDDDRLPDEGPQTHVAEQAGNVAGPERQGTPQGHWFTLNIERAAQVCGGSVDEFIADAVARDVDCREENMIVPPADRRTALRGRRRTLPARAAREYRRAPGLGKRAAVPKCLRANSQASQLCTRLGFMKSPPARSSACCSATKRAPGCTVAGHTVPRPQCRLSASTAAIDRCKLTNVRKTAKRRQCLSVRGLKNRLITRLSSQRAYRSIQSKIDLPPITWHRVC